MFESLRPVDAPNMESNTLALALAIAESSSMLLMHMRFLSRTVGVGPALMAAVIKASGAIASGLSAPKVVEMIDEDWAGNGTVDVC